ncbi:MAG: hypothetical protein Kow0029_23870 [Candidatus Rifleibacteriota bacterium]
MIREGLLYSLIKYFLSPQVSESIFALGAMLEKGNSLIKALDSISASTRDGRIREACLVASDRLKQGVAPESVFRELNVFPPYARYILACPMRDNLKGKLLLAQCRTRSASFREFQSLFLPVQTFAIGGLSSMTLLMFVVPQLNEILRNQGLRPSPFLSFLTDGGGFFAELTIICIVIAFVFVFLKWVLDLNSSSDYLNLLNLFTVLDKNERLHVIKFLGSKILYPREYEKIKAFAVNLGAGLNIEDAGERAQLPMYIRWFLTLGNECEDSSEIIQNGRYLLENAYETRRKIMINILEILSVLILGVLFGTIIYTVFSTMIQIMAVAA